MGRVETNMWLVDNQAHRLISCAYAHVQICVVYVHIIAMCMTARGYLFTCIQTCHSVIILWFCYFQLTNIVEFVTAQNSTNSEFHVNVESLNVRVHRELTRTDELQGSFIILISIFFNG